LARSDLKAKRATGEWMPAAFRQNLCLLVGRRGALPPSPCFRLRNASARKSARQAERRAPLAGASGAERDRLSPTRLDSELDLARLGWIGGDSLGFSEL
jgi:hypothetical protein